MSDSMIKILILSILVLLSLVLLWFQKKQQPVLEGFDVSDGVLLDFDNPNLSSDTFWGDIPQNASISIFKKAELKGLTANPDAIPVSDGDPKTGKGAGPQLTVTDIPDQAPPADDIESQLNAAVNEPAEEGFQSTIQDVAQQQAQSQAQSQAQTLAEKLKSKVAKKMKGSKALNAAKATVAKGKKVAIAGAKKLTKALTGLFAKKVGARVGLNATKAIFSKILAKTATKIGTKAGLALALGSSLMATPVTIAFGIIMNVVAAIGISLAVALPIQFKDGAVCEPGWKSVSENWPSFLDMVPGLGDIMGSMAPFLCSIDQCTANEEESAGLCYAKCDPGYEGVLDRCWSKYESVGVGVLQDCPGGWANDGLICREPINTTLDPCPEGQWDVAGTCWGWNKGGCRGGCGEDCGQDCNNPCCGFPRVCVGRCCNCAGKWPDTKGIKTQLHERNMKTTGGTLLGRMNGDSRLRCPGDHPELIDGLCYAKCPIKGGNPYTVVRKHPVWIKQRPFPKRDAAKAALDAEKAKGDKGDLNKITSLTKAMADAEAEDMKAIIPATQPYIRNPDGPRLPIDGPPPKEFMMFPGPMRMTSGWPPQFVPGPDIQGPRDLMYTQKLADYNAAVAKYAKPSASVLEMNIPMLDENVTVDPRKPLTHAPGAPYQCVGDRGVSYYRGVGNPKLKLKMAGPPPPPPPDPPPPLPYFSTMYADDPATPCFTDFSSPANLQNMCDFYYTSAVTNANTNADGTVSFGYIAKISKVIASSEQSADIICDITNVVVNPDTGKTMSTQVAANSDRRFYFAKITNGCVFIVTACTNVNKTAPDVTTAGAEAKTVTFTPVIKKCGGINITLNKCKADANVTAMTAAYMKTVNSSTLRVKSILGVENTGTNTCSMTWQEVTYDANTNTESAPVTKTGTFNYSQDISSDACGFTLQSYNPAPATTTVKPLATPVVLPSPVPAETTLQGCTTTCKDPIMVQKLVNAFNTKPGNADKILDVGKVVTPSALRCDMEASVFVSSSKQTVNQTIRFDLAKDPGGCVFSVKTVGGAGSGSFIQSNTGGLTVPVNTKDFIISAQQDVAKTAQAALGNVSKKITQYQGAAMTAHDSTLGTFGQIETLDSCPKKCTDADVLNSIIDFYNTANYPASRTNVTKKTISRVIKAGTAGTNLCDVNFEEKQETYADLYTSAPTIAITQKTKRFTMKDNGGCNFVVDPTTTKEGFQGVPFNTRQPFSDKKKVNLQTPRLHQTKQGGQNAQGGLPFAAPRRAEGFQSKTATPSVVNSSSPALNPPFTGSACDLDCSNPDLLRAVKSTYESTNIEGFSPRRPKATWMGALGKWIHGVVEPFQEAEEEAPVEDAPVEEAPVEEAPVEEAPVEEAPVEEDQGAGDTTDTAPEDWATTEEPAATEEPGEEPVPEPVKPKAMASTTLKKVNKTLRVGINKCEFEILYDSKTVDSNGNATSQTGATGYFTGTFSREPNGCVFKPSNVVKATTPIIPSAPSTKTSNIAFSF
jgi:hypothetical protein